ncbi:hypothetical protein [Hymenobacter sediminis]|nr:hypothetical protein [Hymenobacter sediminis]
MKANLSNLAQVLAAQRQAAQPSANRKNSSAASPSSALQTPGTDTAKK